MSTGSNMTGKICVVTGANSGIGRETAAGLAARSAQVVMVCRNEAKGNEARESIQRATGNSQIDLLVADLASLQDVRALAESFNERYKRLDVLIHNAGIMKPKREVSADGFELQFAVHFLAPFLLTHLLLDALKAAAPSRVINLASMLHRLGHINFDDLQAEQRYNMFRTYASSKLATIMFTYLMADRLRGTGVTVNCLHPGVIGSNLESNPKFIRPFLKSPRKGADTPIYLATSPDVAEVTGQYFVNRKPRRTSRESYDRVVAERLWALAEEVTGLHQAKAA
ncbi:MAG: SDR family oxidoreductase [Pseudomonadota bacterium]|nr:SDR family oxidoreductase [Pseudomonadota bacterium]